MPKDPTGLISTLVGISPVGLFQPKFLSRSTSFSSIVELFPKNVQFVKADLKDYNSLKNLSKVYFPKKVIHLAAQAGVRHSIENPRPYINSNLVGFGNVLEFCKDNQVEHLLYASSSSIYGGNNKIPFSEKDFVDYPVSLYAATKKSNELMAHSYSHLFNLPTTGLRFFTVYGPWGRPDMALFKFTKNILDNKNIDLYNNGNHSRDFTYIDDIVSGIISIIKKPKTKSTPFNIFNIGRGNSKKLNEYLISIENKLGKKAKIKKFPLQLGDIKKTHSDISSLKKHTGYKPKTDIDNGINKIIYA